MKSIFAVKDAWIPSKGNAALAEETFAVQIRLELQMEAGIGAKLASGVGFITGTGTKGRGMVLSRYKRQRLRDQVPPM